MSIFITETQPVCFWPACSGLWGWWRKYEHHFMKIMWTSSVSGFNASPGETSLLFWPRRVDFCCWSQFWNGEALWSPFFWQGELPLCCFLHFLVGKKWHKLSAQRLCLLQLALWGVCAWHLWGFCLVCVWWTVCAVNRSWNAFPNTCGSWFLQLFHLFQSHIQGFCCCFPCCLIWKITGKVEPRPSEDGNTKENHEIQMPATLP